MKKKTQSLGEEIIEGLTELRDAMRAGEPLRKKFKVRTVKRPSTPALARRHL